MTKSALTVRLSMLLLRRLLSKNGMRLLPLYPNWIRLNFIMSKSQRITLLLTLIFRTITVISVLKGMLKKQVNGQQPMLSLVKVALEFICIIFIVEMSTNLVVFTTTILKLRYSLAKVRLEESLLSATTSQ